MSSPNYRWLLLEKGTKGVDKLVDTLLNTSFDVSAVREIYKDKVQRSYVESCLLATDNLAVISESLEIKEEILELYRDLCYDVKGLTRLEKIALVAKIKDNDDRTLKMWGVTQGIKFIKWRLGGEISVTPIEGLTQMFYDAYYKSKEAYFNGNTAEASKESAKWFKIAMDLGKQLKQWVTDADEATADINLALKEYIGEDIQYRTIDDLEK